MAIVRKFIQFSSSLSSEFALFAAVKSFAAIFAEGCIDFFGLSFFVVRRRIRSTEFLTLGFFAIFSSTFFCVSLFPFQPCGRIAGTIYMQTFQACSSPQRQGRFLSDTMAPVAVLPCNVGSDVVANANCDEVVLEPIPFSRYFCRNLLAIASNEHESCVSSHRDMESVNDSLIFALAR